MLLIVVAIRNRNRSQGRPSGAEGGALSSCFCSPLLRWRSDLRASGGSVKSTPVCAAKRTLDGFSAARSASAAKQRGRVLLASRVPHCFPLRLDRSEMPMTLPESPSIMPNQTKSAPHVPLLVIHMNGSCDQLPPGNAVTTCPARAVF